MVQEELHSEEEVIASNDSTLVEWEQSLEVWAEVLGVAQKVDEIERIWWLKEFLWLYNTRIADLRVKDLDKRRAANDNKTETKKAA